MHLHFERPINAKCDCAIISLSWMGKVPDELPEDEGWKLNRTNYYQEGWLATGHVRGIVGVTFTTSHCKRAIDYPSRTNYNLRGHNREVIHIKWNEPYQKLASCDSSGVIFVWIKYEGRWSIELINDRSMPVTQFAWSHDGRMALICYRDGFVLVGSVAGQRYWSSLLNLESTITCGIWTPDDLQVYFGTSKGGLVVMDVHGAMVAQVSLSNEPVTSMAWSCEKFKMEEGDENENIDNRHLVLAVSLSSGKILLIKSYDDVSPVQINTGLKGPLSMDWSNNKQILAVAGTARHMNNVFTNIVQCYTEAGELLYSTQIPNTQSRVTALTWGHNDKRLFVATGGVINVAWVSRRVASLQLLSRLKIASSLRSGESSVQDLHLPPKIKHLITNLFAQTIWCCVPESKDLREFVSRPPLNGTRLHCTMVKHDDEPSSSGTAYTLYLEYLGGLVPLLKGKRTSKIRPEFVIFDPQVDGEHKDIPCAKFKVCRGSDSSDTEREEGCSGSPRVQRKRRRRRRSPPDFEEDLIYIDTLPEDARLVEVTSNIWGTKFKIHGLGDCVPANLGQVTYKTSLLHLQPRQMSLVMTELRDDVPHVPDPFFNPKVFSEDEEEEKSYSSDKNNPQHSSGGSGGGAIPIAPMTPRREESRPRLLNTILNRGDGTGTHFFRSARFIYTDPSLLGHRTELRKPMINFHRNTGTSSSQDDSSEHEDRMSSELIYERSRPSSSSNTQPSLSLLNDKTSLTYQNESNCSNRDDDECYNLSELLTYCENFKMGDVDNDSTKPRQEKTETSFLNNQTHRSRKSTNLQSPKKPGAPCNLSEGGTPNAISASSKISSPNIHKMNDTLEKQKKAGNDELKFIDEDADNLIDRMSRSCSVGYLDDVDTGLVPCEQTLKLLKKDSPKRLILVGDPKKKNGRNRPSETKSNLKSCGKSRSLDSGELFMGSKNDAEKTLPARKEEKPKADVESKVEVINDDIVKQKRSSTKNHIRLPGGSSDVFPPPSPRLPRSQPVTPEMGKKKRNQSSSPIRKHLLNSPLLRRRSSKSKPESSDDDVFSGDEAFTSRNHFKDLETFQKAQLRRKLKRGKVRDGSATPKIRELVMQNKAPMWNEHSQVYQLDFGGRVTQESAKNFQIEYKDKQVMQFGRIDGNAYTLDFQYPFSVLQAFSVALANVTQRLK